MSTIENLETTVWTGSVDVRRDNDKVVLTISYGSGGEDESVSVRLSLTRARLLEYCMLEPHSSVSFGYDCDEKVSLETTSFGTRLSLQEGTVTVMIPDYSEYTLRCAIHRMADEIEGAE